MDNFDQFITIPLQITYMVNKSDIAVNVTSQHTDLIFTGYICICIL